MDELLLHVLDIVQNSISGGATLIFVEIVERSDEDLLSIAVSDNGKGMDEETLRAVEDPFFTTKAGKKVGLGIPLLKQTVTSTGGYFQIDSHPGKGTIIRASFPKSHVDLPPLGDLKGTILALVFASGNADIVFSYDRDGRIFSLDTRSMKEILGEVPFSHPEVIKFLNQYLDDGIKELEGKSKN